MPPSPPKHTHTHNRYRLPESPRWLLVNGRMDELIAIIRVAAHWNRIRLPAGFEKKLQRPDEEVTVGFCQLFRGSYTYMSLLTMVSWYTMILLYFGITLGLNHLGGDLYVNTVRIATIVPPPAPTLPPIIVYVRL